MRIRIYKNEIYQLYIVISKTTEDIQVYFTSDEYYTQEGAGRVVIGIVAERPISFGPEDIFVGKY